LSRRFREAVYLACKIHCLYEEGRREESDMDYARDDLQSAYNDLDDSELAAAWEIRDLLISVRKPAELSWGRFDSLYGEKPEPLVLDIDMKNPTGEEIAKAILRNWKAKEQTTDAL
jgi:hypothetical protein